MTEEGKGRLKEGGMEGAYLGEDGRVHIPGKRVTLYSEPSPPQHEVSIYGGTPVILCHDYLVWGVRKHTVELL